MHYPSPFPLESVAQLKLVHCLISLSKDQTISKAVQLIKGESSNWINRNRLTKTKFIWQDDYCAVSVSESHITSLRS
jgi:REP element-mobilizing transposase RayT